MTKRPINMPNNEFTAQISKILQIFSHLLITSLLISCASTPPSKTLPQSKVAVSSVDHSNYRNHVNSDVENVKIKLQQAQKLAADQQHGPAEYLAQQILVDVELIQIKTQRLNVEQEVSKIKTNITNLHKELKWREPIQLTPLN